MSKLRKSDALPCPYCGNKPFVAKALYLWNVYCDTKWCEWYHHGGSHVTKDRTIGAWNYIIKRKINIRRQNYDQH